MNILKSLASKVVAFDKSEGRVTEVKGKYHRLSHQNGLIELSFNLNLDQRAAFDARSIELEKALHKVISASTDTLNAKIAEARREAEVAVKDARAKYDADLFALFSEFGRIPTREQLITTDTPVGHVVQLPESAVIAQTESGIKAVRQVKAVTV